MIITISGDNGYLIKAELAKLVAEFRSTKDELGIEKLEGQDQDYETLIQSLTSYSLLSTSRLIVLIEPSKVKQFTDNIEQLASDLPDTTDLVIVEPSLDKRLSYYKFLKSNTDFRLFNNLTGPKLIDWIINYTKSLGGEINYGEANHLVNRIGEDQLLISNELEKLVLYSKHISVENIDLLSEESPDSTIFQLLDAAFNDNPVLALELYKDQRLQKVEPEQLLSMLTWQVQIVALYMTSKTISLDELVAATKLSPFALQKARVVATKLSFSSLKRLVHELAQMDMRSKTENFDLDEGLKNFIVDLSLAKNATSFS